MDDRSTASISSLNRDSSEASKSPSMDRQQRADSVQQATDGVERLGFHEISEAEERQRQSQAILDKLSKATLFDQRNVADWREGIPGLDMENDPSWQGLGGDDFEPLPQRPPPLKGILKRPAETMTGQPRYALYSSHTAEERAKMRATMNENHRRPARVPVDQRLDRATRASGEPQRMPSTRLPEDDQRGSSTTRPSISQPPQTGPQSIVGPAGATYPTWAKIEGPSTYVQDAMAVRGGMPPQNSSTQNHGRAQDAISSNRAQEALDAAAHVDAEARADSVYPIRQSTEGNNGRCHIDNPVPNPPPDRFLAENRAAIPRDPHAGQTRSVSHHARQPPISQSWPDHIYDVQVPRYVPDFVQRADAKRDKDRADKVEGKRYEKHKNGGFTPPSTVGIYWGINNSDRAQLFAPTDYVKNRFGDLRQAGDDPKTKDADKNTAFVEREALNGHVGRKKVIVRKEGGPGPHHNPRKPGQGSNHRALSSSLNGDSSKPDTINPDNMMARASAIRPNDNGGVVIPSVEDDDGREKPTERRSSLEHE